MSKNNESLKVVVRHNGKEYPLTLRIVRSEKSGNYWATETEEHFRLAGEECNLIVSVNRARGKAQELLKSLAKE